MMDEAVTSPAKCAPSSASSAAVGSQKRGHREGNPGTAEPRKRRAPRACCECRTRKVRCDVSQHGPPCTNCRLDYIECASPVLQERQSNNHLAAKKVRRNTLTKSSRSAELFALPGHGESHQQSSITVAVAPNMVFMSEDDDCSAQSGDQTMPGRSSDAIPAPTTNKVQRDTTSKIRGSLTDVAVGASQLPPFIRPLRVNLDPIEMEYLRMKGVFWVPEKDALEELLQTYFDVVYPFAPILDREVITKVVKGQIYVHEGEDVRISLLLIQALLFVSTAFVSSSFLDKWGYGTRADFRYSFYQRAKLLYDLDLEPDPVAHLQGLLLLTYWFKPDAAKNGWFWLEAAVSQVQIMDLSGMIQRESGPKKRSLLKRLWWCCFIKENATHLELRQIPRLRREICQVEPLSLEDFWIREDEHDLEPLSQVEDTPGINGARERTIAILCIEMAKLCVCLNRILSVRVTATCLADSDLPNPSGSWRMSKQRAIILETKACDALLRQWKDQLHAEAQWQDYSSEDRLDISIKIHRIILNLMYFAAMSTLYQVQGFPLTAEAPKDAEGRQFHELSKRKVCFAAHEITKLADVAGRQQLAPYSPDYILVLLLPAIVIHLLRFRSRQFEAREEASQSMRICFEFVEGLKETCPAAHRVIDLLAPALDKFGCSQTSNTQAEDGTAQPVGESTFTVSSPLPECLLSSSSMAPGIDMDLERLMDRNVFTPPASPSTNFGLHNKNLDMISSSAGQITDAAPGSIYNFEDVGMSEMFLGFNTMGSTDILFDQFFTDLELPVPGFLESSDLFL